MPKLAKRPIRGRIRIQAEDGVQMERLPPDVITGKDEEEDEQISWIFSIQEVF